MKSMCLSTLSAAAIIFAPMAHASDPEDLKAGIMCKPAKDLIKVITKMTTMKPEKTDTVSAFPKMQFQAKEGGSLPDRLFVRTTSKEIELPLAADGKVSNLSSLSGITKDSDFCFQDETIIGAEKFERKMGVSMDFDISYKNRSGSHDIAELRDGLDDGRAHIKKLVPAPVRLMIPKFDHVLIEYLDESGETIEKDPQIRAYKGDQKLDGLVLERLENMHFVNIDQLEDLGADRLRIEGGPYKMDPSPNAEKIKDLMKDD